MRQPRTVNVPNEPHAGNYLDSLPNDMARARHCGTMVERYRNEWFRQQQNSVAIALASSNPQYGKSSLERTAIAKQRWGASAESKNLIDMERMWWRWCIMYQGFAGMRLPAGIEES